MASVSQLKAEISSLEKQLKTIKKRLQELAKIGSGLEKKLDAQLITVNRNIDSCSNKIESGLWGFRGTKELPGDVKQKLEPSCMTDSCTAQMFTFMELEARRCDGERVSLEDKIRRKKAELEEAKRREREAKKLW